MRQDDAHVQDYLAEDDPDEADFDEWPEAVLTRRYGSEVQGETWWWA